MKTRLPSVLLRFATLAVLSFATLASISCSKDKDNYVVDNTDYAQIDETDIKSYLAANSITNARRQTSGLYYVPVLTDTTGVRATARKTVAVYYKGTFLNGDVFDSALAPSNPISFVLGKGNVIAGWDEGIALMHKGEKGILLIPSALAYGSFGSGPIPPHTVLRFEVELANVQ